MRDIGNFKCKSIYKTFFIGQYFLLTSRLQDWTLQSSTVNIITYDCKELIFRPVPSSFFPQITTEPTTLSLWCLHVCREGMDHVTDCYFCMTNLQGKLIFVSNNN